ncbi:MAG: hypothetical protein EHM20_13680 [Alphaproteobacteria bacterium]|nr:MAG: hypothetical protein EHM20_13680 [Alphaproteobacteria bacterium]
MCEVCKSEGDDYRFRNGPKTMLATSNLYKVFKNAVAPIKLCHVHTIELFHIGERRFLREHLTFARGLASRSASKVGGEDSSYGF